jgi:hypothetical protein|tara:strand:+ start:587 stop:1330 length:744 start_codon:yes stop_codon:yes gene_type:complete
MASSYSNRLRTELIGSGEQANSWGDTTNNNFTNIFDEAISAVYDKSLSGTGGTYTLASAQGPVTQANNEVRQAAIRFHTFTTAKIIQQPLVNGAQYDRIYIVINDGTGSGTIQFKLEGGNSSEIIAPGGRAILATNGVNWFTINSGGNSASSWRTITAATDNVFSGEKIFVNTSSNAITLTLPAAPATGDQISFLDIADNFDTAALTLNPNSLKIFGASANGTVSTEGAGFTLVYTGATYGWKITEK